MSDEFENAMKVLREKANKEAYNGQASMRVPLSMLLGILGRAEEWPELARLRAANAELMEALNRIANTCDGFDECPVGPQTIAEIARAALSRAEHAGKAEGRQG